MKKMFKNKVIGFFFNNFIKTQRPRFWAWKKNENIHYVKIPRLGVDQNAFGFTKTSITSILLFFLERDGI